MSENAKQGKTLEERIKSLETLQRNTRIAIIILVGYSIYDVISVDSGEDIVFARKVKALEFQLIDGQGGEYGSWKVPEKSAAALVIQSTNGNRMTMTANEMKFTSDRINPYPRMTLDDRGIRIHENTNSASADTDAE
ncbi:MAG: hypothetical protein R8G33_11965 [Gammaproteobacteria bacterium]|nr:hypothetical protein [Gammaproteobacteria bacterium]